MKKLLVVMSTVILMMGVGTSRLLAQPAPENEDLIFNLNGTVDDAGGLVGPSDGGVFASNIDPGVSGASIDFSAYTVQSGLGTITLTYNPGVSSPTSFFFDALTAEAVGVPDFNEYGSISGSPSQSWEIGFIPTDGSTPAIFNDVVNNTLDGTNNLPLAGTNDSTCVQVATANGCNGFGLMALGLSFSLDANEEEVISITTSLTAPGGGFYLEQTNPADANEVVTGPTTVYFSLSGTEEAACTSNCAPPPPVPEPGSWILSLTGLLGVGIMQLRRKLSLKGVGTFAGVLALFAMALTAPMANAQVVKTVPWDPTNLLAPHTTYPINGTTEVTIVLGAMFDPQGSTDSFKYTWNFGDGSSPTAQVAVVMTNGIGEDISATHAYPVSAAVTTAWTAQVTVIDTTTNTTAAVGSYPVIQEANNLSSRVNVTIDRGLWYLHQSMYRPSATTGNWDANCGTESISSYDCSGYGSLTATNVQALEVSGHTAAEADAANDPLAMDAGYGLASMVSHLYAMPLADEYSEYVGYGSSKPYTYNPAQNNFGCSDGTEPTTTLTGTAPTVPPPTSTVPYDSGVRGYCGAGATEVFYNPNATSCTTPPCSFTFDGNGNGLAVFAWQESGAISGWGYEAGMYADSLVASGTPNAMATITNYEGGTVTESYQNIVQDIMDATAFCQWPKDNTDVESGDLRGYPYGGNTGAGGGWWYACVEGNDNSVSQWASIGLIAGKQGFGLSIPSIVTDASNMWVTASEDMASSKPTGTNPWNNGTGYYEGGFNYGGFGYNGSLYYSEAWGPFATTPSGMVQMSLAGVGRTPNTVFGDGSTSEDQRFNAAETWYADNFCNSPTLGATDAPRAYYYGLFSFTKSMLLHNPGGVGAPIQYLRTATSNVFTGDAGDPPNSIDWYAALSSANGGTDACDGVAQTIITDQNVTPTGSSYWYGQNYEGPQDQYQTAWALIMLKKTVFVTCVNNLAGAGEGGSGLTKPRADLVWSPIPNVTGYNILKSTTSGGPYTQVAYAGGTTTKTAFADETGLTNGVTYYYVVDPINAQGFVCQSNQATIKIPAKL